MASKTVTERKSLYGGSVVIDYYPNSHQYKLVELDGVKLDKPRNIKSPSSIVGIIDKSRFLIPWAVNCFKDRMIEEMRDGANFSRDDVLAMIEVSKNAHTEKKKAAADIGTIVHRYAQTHFDVSGIEAIEGYDELSDEDKVKAKHGQAAFDSWYAQAGGKSVKNEFMVYSKKEDFVGTCDDLTLIGNEYFIFDYKTSKGIYAEQIYQVTSYMKAHEEEFPEIKISGAKLLHICKEDVYDREGNLVMRAGDYGELYLSRGDLVKAYKVFKGLKMVAYNHPYFEALIAKSKHK